MVIVAQSWVYSFGDLVLKTTIRGNGMGFWRRIPAVFPRFMEMSVRNPGSGSDETEIFPGARQISDCVHALRRWKKH